MSPPSMSVTALTTSAEMVRLVVSEAMTIATTNTSSAAPRNPITMP